MHLQVLLDTNQIFDDPFLTRPSLLALVRHRTQAPFDIAVPEVVFEEAVRQYGKHLARRPARGPEELTVPGERDPPLGDPEWLVRYKTRLLDRLKDLNIAVLPEPDSALIESWREKERKPFKAGSPGNDGDARIWATALRSARSHDVILISNNRKDFGRSSDVLADQLLADLMAEGLSADKVILRSSIVRALGDLGAPYVSRAEAADLLARGRGRRALFEGARRVSEARLVDDELAALLPLGTPLDPETVWIEQFEPRNLDVGAAYRIGERDIAVEVAVRGWVRVDVLVYRADAFTLADDSPISIDDYEFNESYAEGQAEFELELIFETTVGSDRSVARPALVDVVPLGDASGAEE